MRPLATIKQDIADCEKHMHELLNEVKAFQKACPHPSAFVTARTEDNEDDCMGPAIYEDTVITFTCAACEGKFHGRYHKEREPRPTLEQLLKGK